MSNLLFAGYPISSPIQSNRTVKGQTKDHNGTDYAVPMNTVIQSTTAGTVIFAGFDKDGFGNYVKVRDNSGNTHIYAHLNEISVKTGDNVNALSALGFSGNTGFSTGPHLHYEVRDSSGGVIDGTKFVGAVADLSGGDIVTEEITMSTTDADLSKWQRVLSTVIVFIVLFGVFILAVVSFMKAFDISVPNVSGLLKGAK